MQHNAGKVLIDAFYSGPPSPSCLSFCTLSLHIGGRGGDVLGGEESISLLVENDGSVIPEGLPVLELLQASH